MKLSTICELVKNRLVINHGINRARGEVLAKDVCKLLTDLKIILPEPEVEVPPPAPAPEPPKVA